MKNENIGMTTGCGNMEVIYDFDHRSFRKLVGTEA